MIVSKYFCNFWKVFFTYFSFFDMNLLVYKIRDAFSEMMEASYY